MEPGSEKKRTTTSAAVVPEARWMDLEPLEFERLRDFDGSCIDACRFWGLFAITTTVEPSSVNLSQYVTLWLSRDGFDWKQAYRGVKDRWHVHLFQYGRILLPAGRSGRELVCFSTQALRGSDGMSFVARLADPSSL